MNNKANLPAATGTEPPPTPAPDKQNSKGNNKGKRNKQRSETHRATKNVQTEQDYTKDLTSRLASGFNIDADAPKIGLQLRQITTPLTVTSRGVGFATNFTHSKLSGMRNLPVGYTVHRLYRVGLAGFEGALQATERYSSFAVPEHSGLFAPRVYDPRFVEVVQLARYLPTPIAKIVNAIGEFEVSGIRHTPYLSPVRVYQGRMIPLSFTTVLSNLRRTVEILADANTPLQHRLHYYSTSAIPGAIWNNAPVNPTLANADEIIPADYDLEAHLAQDITSVKDVMPHLGKKYPKLTTEIARYDGKGDPAATISNHCAGMRLPDRLAGETVEAYYARIAVTGPTSGDIPEYWTRQTLSPASVIVGATLLLGEVPEHAGYAYPYYGSREAVAKTHSVDQGYAASMTALY